MPRSLTLLAAFMLPLCVFSQAKDAPSFGKIDKADLQANNCPFEKDAVAEVLANVGEYSIEFLGGRVVQTLHCHTRIKILSEKGLEYANIKIPYLDRNNDESIVNLVASTYNLGADGKVETTKLEKSLVYDTRMDAYRSQKIFSMPNVKVGSVIEYRYNINNPLRKTWYLQRAIPVKYSLFTVSVPSMLKVYIRPFCGLPFETKDESTVETTYKRFSMKNIPGLRDEDFMTCDDDYMQKIEMWPVAIIVDGISHDLLKSWKDKATDLLNDESFGLQLKKSIPRTSDLDQILSKLTDPYKKMLAIHDYVRKNMKWDGEDNIFASAGVKSAWKDHTGTGAEINLILINLLRDAGLKVLPVMASSHRNGMITTAFPDIYQFNKILALVQIQDKKYFLDATDRFTPSGVIPEEVLNTEALVLDQSNENNFWWTMLVDSARLVKDFVLLQASIDPKGTMDGHATIRSQDYSRVNRARQLIMGKEKFLNRYCYSSRQGLKIDSLEIENQDNDSLALIQNLSFHTAVNQSGDYSYFSTNLFLGMDVNPFISDQRFSDIFFGTEQSRTLVASVRIPEGYEFEELPKNKRIVMEDRSLIVSRFVELQNGILSTRLTLEYKRPFYTIAEYPLLKDFYKKMYALLDEQYIIKKKA